MSKPIPTLRFEAQFWRDGLTLVAGIDEAGRGAWAGPVVAGAVILPRLENPRAWQSVWRDLRGARDSKLLSPRQREKLFSPIAAISAAHATGAATQAEIDQLGIVPATRLAMLRAIAALALAPDALLIDALTIASPLPLKAIIRGDQISLSIACASIIAKVTRDRMMIEMDAELPGYAFAQHKGYGTQKHQAALARLGVSREHRVSFAPIKRRFEGGNW